MSFITTGLYAFFSTIGFAVLFNIPRRQLFYAGLAGVIGWLTYRLFQDQSQNPIISNFFGGLAATFIGEIFARLRKQPATLFVIPGIIPLVPGYGLYYTMMAIIEKDYQTAVSVGFETSLIAIAIASAIIITTSLGRLLKEWLKVN